MITVDDDLILRLKEMNASATINKLLRDYFDISENLTIEELRQKTIKIAEKKKILMQKMRYFKAEIAKKQAKIDQEKQKNKTNAQKEQRKRDVAEIQRKYKNEEISEEEYWEFFDE